MKQLLKVLKQSDTVLFIGSGISAWSGLPSWAGAIKELANFLDASDLDSSLVKKEAEKGELIQAASYGLDRLTKEQMGEYIRNICRIGSAKPKEIHRNIVNLGPRFYITTNYDDLIEQSLRKWQPDRPFRVVTNRQLTETADLVRADGRDYVFKPHGDAGDLDSIIMSREQYGKLLPQGSRHAALDSLKTLLVSRPVIYLGFGLRDPDFLYLRDILHNTFKGGTRDHYAVIADVSEAESDFWRRHYGIHLVSYATKLETDGHEDHSKLLDMLDRLLEKKHDVLEPSFDPRMPESILALARHAARLMEVGKLRNELQLRVCAGRTNPTSTRKRDWPDRFDYFPIQKFLDHGPERTLLIGLPGAGKSYAVSRSAARLGEELNKLCLAEPFEPRSAVVPILVDLKMYRGNLIKLVNQSLPSSLTLDLLLKHFKVKVFLDSFNEMPREYLENGSAASDFAKFVAGLGKPSVVIASRTLDSLEGLGLSAYTLDHVDEKDVISELERVNVKVEGTFSHEVMALLQRPFYLRYVTSRAIQLPKEAQPKDFYRALLKNTNTAFKVHFNTEREIVKALARVAYDAIDQGEEAFALKEFLSTFESEDLGGESQIDAIEVANWLVSHSILVPYSGGRVAFIHQSVTEFLAASELARRYESNPDILKDRLTNLRWDQSLFLCLSLLPNTVGEEFLNDVIEADFTLGLRAAKYLEVGRDEVVARLLSEIPSRIRGKQPFERKMEIATAIGFGLPIKSIHEEHIRVLIALGDMIGAVGVQQLVELNGDEVKDELLRLLVDRCDDFNLCCNGVGSALKHFAVNSDVQKIVAWADSIEADLGPGPRTDDDAHGFIAGATEFLSQLELQVVRQSLLGEKAVAEISDFRMLLLCNILSDRHSPAALELAGELVLLGVQKATVSLYFIASYSKSRDELSWTSFSSDHVQRLISMMDAEDSWALAALECLCAARPDLAELVKREASSMSGIGQAALRYCVSPLDHDPVFRALEALLGMNNKERERQPVQILRRIDCNWAGRERLFVNLLRLRDARLASAIFGGTLPPSVSGLGNLEIGPIDYWLEWMMDARADDCDPWFLGQLGGLFGLHLPAENQEEFVREFNRQNSKFRQLLVDFVIPNLSDVSTDSFSEDAVSFLLADLDREEGVPEIRGSVLGSAATEEFATERLLPLLEGAKEPRMSKLKAILKHAGSRHNRRYIDQMSD